MTELALKGRPGRCPCCGKKYLAWTPAQMIDAVRAHATEHGHAPTIAEWKKARKGNPSASSVQYIFGSWGEFLDAAGLPRNESNRTRWTREAIIDSILEFRFTVGRWPTSEDFKKATPGQPCLQTISIAFGTWAEARRAAGYTGLDRAQHRGGEERACAKCGVAANDSTPGCRTCRRRQSARMLRDVARRGAAPVTPRCSGCGGDLDNRTVDCETCADRLSRRAKVAA